MNSFSCNSSPLTHRYIVIALPKVSSTSVCFYSDVGWFVSVNMLFLFTKHPQLSFTYFSYTVTHHYVRNSCTRNIGSLALWITIYWYIYIYICVQVLSLRPFCRWPRFLYCFLAWSLSEFVNILYKSETQLYQHILKPQSELHA